MATATQSQRTNGDKQDFANYAPGFANRFRRLPGARSLILSSGLAIVTAVITGPFQTGAIPVGERLLFWAASIGLVAFLWRCWFASTVTGPRDWFWSATVGTVAMVAAMPLVVSIILKLVGRNIGPNWWIIWPKSLGLALVVSGGIYLLARQRQVKASKQIQGRLWRHGVTDMGRLMRAEAEDHYLRLTLDDGRSLLVHERFSAIAAELDALDGCVVRRGRWIATSHVDVVERHGRRLSVRTKDGQRIPVSPSGRDAMRHRGWI